MPAQVYHYNLYGKRDKKYDFLKNNSVSTVKWAELQPDEKYHFFVPKNFDEQVEWEEGIKVSELFELQTSGITTSRDVFVTDYDKEKLFDRIKDFKYLGKSELLYKYDIRDNISTSIDDAKEKLVLNNGDIILFSYRVFDQKYIYLSDLLIHRSRMKASKHFKNKNINLSLMRQFIENVDFNHVLLSSSPIDNRYFFSSRGTAYQFPLYLYPENTDDLMQDQKPRPNFNPTIIKQIEEKLGMEMDWAAGIGKSFANDEKLKFSATDLLDYIYAVLHSPSYREKYKEFLKIDFPRIPFLKNNHRFWNLVKLGGKLRKLHLLEGINPLELDQAEISGEGENVVEKIKYQDGKVWINDSKYFYNVPEVAWNFYIGGYQPAQKWLKDRKGRELSFDDILHYQKIVWVLGETERVMGEVDK